MRHTLAILGLVMASAGTAESGGKAASALLFDFENSADLRAWSNLELPEAKAKEPPAQIALSTDHATSGKHSLKLTFAGGNWPTVTTTEVLSDWLPYQTFEADVTVARHCVVGFTALQEKSQRGVGWDALVSRWTKTAFLQPGLNHIMASIPQPNEYAISSKWGKVIRFEAFMYRPREGESIYIDNIRLVAKKHVAPPLKLAFPVAGTDWAVSGVTTNEVSSARAVIELGKKLREGWTRPEARTVAQVEDAFRTRFAELRKTHPKAVFAVLRDGEKGYDPAEPDRVYAGWKDAYFNSHGPDGNYVERARNQGKSATYEIFMRHRSPLTRVDLSSIPNGSDILAAQLVIVRASQPQKEHDPEKKPTMWVVEPCNRAWDEYEVNAFEYAKERFWKAIGGMHWGEDPDFLPMFLAYGPGQGKVNTWDFTEAVRFWTSGKQANHGFMLHGDSHDYMIAHSREAPNRADRPAVLVIYEPRR
jgi:hypothetical protein